MMSEDDVSAVIQKIAGLPPMVPVEDVLDIVMTLLEQSKEMIGKLTESQALARKSQAIADGALAHGTRLSEMCTAYACAFESVADVWNQAYKSIEVLNSRPPTAPPV